MNNEMKHVPGRTDWTYQSEEAEWKADHVSYRTCRPTKSEMLSIIQEQVTKEYNTVCDEEFFYFEFPEMFEKDVSALGDYSGDLASAELAWIINTREAIQNYHAITYQEAA